MRYVLLLLCACISPTAVEPPRVDFVASCPGDHLYLLTLDTSRVGGPTTFWMMQERQSVSVPVSPGSHVASYEVYDTPFTYLASDSDTLDVQSPTSYAMSCP